MRSTVLLLATLLLATLLLTACSDEASDSSAFLEATVTVYDAAEEGEQQYRCDADGHDAASGDPDAGCRDLVAEQDFLVEGEPDGALCTGLYGGPEVATIEGTVDGEAFVRNIDRTDGCGIQRWDDLSGALGEPDGEPLPEM